MDGSRLAERLLETSRMDAALRAELRDAWRGTLDVQDALWWHVHPMTPTPEGQPDPASELPALKAAVYSRRAEAEPVFDTLDPVTGETHRSTPSERALQAALRRHAQNADAMAALLEHFRPGRQHPAPPAPGVERTDAGSPDEDIVLHRPRERRSVPPRRTRDILLLAAGAAVGAIVILAAQILVHAPGTPDAVPASSASAASPAPTKEAVDTVLRDTPTDSGSAIASGWVMVPPDAESGPFWIFEEPATLRSRGVVPDLGPDFVASSIRTLASTEQYAVYVAQNRSNEYCLVVADGGHAGWAGSCDRADVIRSSGLWLSVPVANRGDSGATTDFNVTWGADGSFSMEPSASAVR